MNDGIGEFYVSEICQLFRTNGRDLHAGRVTFCLTATCVEYITRKLSMLQIGSSITNPPSSQDWTNLPVYLESVKNLKLIEDRNLPLRLPVNLSPFKHINTLVLKRLPVNLVIGLQRLRQQLKNLIVQRCLNDIDDVLVFCGGDNANAFVWTSLVELNLSHNSVRSFGDALKYLPAVQKVDLSDNQVSTDHNGIQYVDTATFVHLGFNRLITMPTFGPRAKYNLTLLCIRNNNLDNLDGIEFLERLTELDTADNCIAEHKRLNVLASLHHLTNLVLIGNPISAHSYYRKETCTCMSSLLDPKTVQLDGSFLSTTECKLLGQRSTNTVTVLTPEQQVFSVVIPGTGYMTPEGDVESSTPVRSPKTKRKKRKARRVNLSDSEDPLSSTGHTPSKDSSLKHYDRRKKQERMRKELQAKWLTVANFEENANRQTTSNIETVEEVDVTQQVTLVAAGDTVVGLKMNQKENCGSVKRETENGVHLLEHQKFDVEDSFLVRLYDSDTDELSSLDRLYVCLSDRFLVERDFGSAKVIDKLDLHCLLSATVTDVQNIYHKTSFMMVLYFNYERRDRRKREYVMQNEQDTKKLMDMLLPVIKKNKTEVAVNTKMECLECHSIIDSKQVVMKESSDSDRNVTTIGFSNPFTTTSPQHLERLCPFCESSSIVEKTSLSGSMPNYNANILTDSVLARASPYGKSPILSSPVLNASNRTPVSARKAEFVVQLVTSHEDKEEEAHRTPTPPILDDSSYEECHETPPMDDMVQMEVTENTQVEILVDNDGGSQEVSVPVVVPAKEEITSEAPHEEPVEVKCEEPVDVKCEEPVEVKCDGIPEVSFETTIGSLPSQSFEDHGTSFNKLTHSRSRSMDYHTKQTSSNRTPYYKRLSSMHPREADETETSYTASLMEYATHKKLLKSSEASLESSLSISGAATLSDSLVPGNRYTQSSSDSRSVTPTGIPYSLDDPLYIHNSFKLYLELKVFQDDEEFKLLLRCSAVTFGQPQEFACLVLVTNEFIYICQIVAPVGSSPSKWLKFLHSHPLKKLEFVDYGLGYQSVTIEFSPPESVWYKLFPQDQQRCQDFVERLTNVVSDVQNCKFKGIKTQPQSLINLQSQVLQEHSLSKEEIFGQWLCETLKQTSGLIHDRKMYLKNYPQCFSGTDLVQWLTNREEYEDNESALNLCRHLMDNNVICSVGDERQFEPDKTLYRFVTDHHKQLTLSGRVQDHSSDKQPADVLELYLLGKWLKSGNLSQVSVTVVVSSSEIFLVRESNLWPLPRYAKLPSLDNIPPQFSVLQQRKINEIHCLVLDRDQPHHVTVTFFAEDLADADVHSWLLIFETENNAKNLTKAIKVCWEAEFGIEFQINEK